MQERDREKGEQKRKTEKKRNRDGEEEKERERAEKLMLAKINKFNEVNISYETFGEFQRGAQC